MAQLISGNKISKSIRAELKVEVASLAEKGHRPGLAVVIVGDDPASKVYVNNKKKGCEEVGIHSEEYALPAETTEAELIELIEKLNNKDDIHGILVQLPVPKHISDKAIIGAISTEKDVDAFSHESVGKISVGEYIFAPCTPFGVIELLKRSNIEISGKHCVVVGRSNIVGKPMSMLLLENNGTVTVCHSRTKDIASITRQADILVAAVGRPNFVTGDMVKEGVVVMDVGINRMDDGKLCGDVHFESVEPKASYITPVPGGVGPMTITMLLRNTVEAAKHKANNK